jgi:hypothetical protein
MLYIKMKYWRKVLKYSVAAATCFFVSLNAPLAGVDFNAELNRLLFSSAEKEPELFGSDPLCERDNAFWGEVKNSSLLAVLEKEPGFKAVPIDQNHTVWFVPISPCFSGNRAGVMLIARIGDQFYSDETPITGDIENVRLAGDKIVFDVTTYGGIENEYRYLYTYDGKELTQQLLEQIRR